MSQQSVDWLCGLTCGHTISVYLRKNALGTWEIADLLLTSRHERLAETTSSPGTGYQKPDNVIEIKRNNGVTRRRVPGTR